MSNNSNNTSAVSKYILEGRLVTLGNQGVLPKRGLPAQTSGELWAINLLRLQSRRARKL